MNLRRTLFSYKRNWRSLFRSTLYLQILSVHSFEKIPILQAFCDGDHRLAATALPNQLNLFNT